MQWKFQNKMVLPVSFADYLLNGHLYQHNISLNDLEDTCLYKKQDV